jgi:uncharacterized protein
VGLRRRAPSGRSRRDEAAPPPRADRVEAVLRPVTALGIDDEIVQAAASVEPTGLRSLDAIHLASALVLGEVLDALVTYDARLGEAAEAAGVRVLSPR